MNEMVLEIEDGEADDGKKIVTNGHHGGDSQLWYTDYIFGVIRSKLNDKYVFGIDDGKMIIKEFDEDDADQQFVLYKDQIRHIETGKVVDIEGCCSDEGTNTCAWGFNGQDNQRWTFNYVEPCLMMIRSKMNGKVMDVEGGDDGSGADVIIWEENGGENQLWYEDRHGLIYSKISDLVLDSGDDDRKIEMKKYNGTLKVRQWIRCGDRIVNRFNPKQCIDIKHRNDDNGADLVNWRFRGKDHQLWEVNYV